jgi:hypothetical protein
MKRALFSPKISTTKSLTTNVKGNVMSPQGMAWSPKKGSLTSFTVIKLETTTTTENIQASIRYSFSFLSALSD